ncbi:MAG: OmpA family protein [Acetobacteraceae bacterium]
MTDATLNPTTLHALQSLAADAAERHAPSVTVAAYAARDPSDPSTPRRLSLSRALAARAVFREAGIPSERIYVRALLIAEQGSAPVNRVDVTLAAAPKGSQ